MRDVRLVVAAVLAALLLAAPAAAKFDPAHRWRTAETAHFTVHFHEGCEEIAARAAPIAEEVHALLSPRIGWSPRGRTHLIIADDADAAGGWATPYPYNQILIAPTPPLGEPGLGTTRHDDWLRLILTHEYTHILQLDMASRLPLALRSVFGRLYFPNALQPEWLIEGLATLEETELTAGGRGRSPGAEMVLRMAVLQGPFPTLDQMAVLPDRWPAGEVPYLFGESFLRYLSGRFGREKVAEVSRVYGGRSLPFLVESTGRRVIGAEYRDLWREWSASLVSRFSAQESAVAALGPSPSTPLTQEGGVNVAAAWSPDGGRIAWLRADGHDYPGIWVMNADGTGRRRLVRNAFSTSSSGATLAWSPDGGRLYYTKRGFVRGTAVHNDIWAYDFARGREIRVTRGLRARDPHPSPDGRTLALVTASGGLTRLALLDVGGELPARESSRLRYLTEPSAAQYAEPRWSPDGRRIAASVREPGGAKDVLILDGEGRTLARLARDRALDGAPAWGPDGRLLYLSSDRTGIFNLFSWDPASDELRQLTNVVGGAFCPAPSPDGRRLAFSDYTARGYDIRVLELSSLAPSGIAAVPPERRVEPAPPPAPAAIPLGSRPAFAPDTLLPRLWFPWASMSPESGTLGGFITGGQDVLQRHRYLLTGLYAPESGRLMHLADYSYDGLRPTLRLLSSDVDRTYGGFLRTQRGSADYTERERTVGAEAALSLPGFESSQEITLGYRYRELSELTPLAPQARIGEGGPALGSLGSSRLAWRFSSAHRQRFSISPEEGSSLLLALERFQEGLGSERSFTRAAADWTHYLPLPGRHHVLAARLVLGGTSGAAPPQGAFLLGGDAPGDIAYSLDDRALHLRGYPPGADHGSRALLAGLEYRFPLAEIGRGGVSAPFFLRRLHGALFVDAGDAWDEGEFQASAIRTGIGVELRLDLFFSYFVPVTLRLGISAGLDEGGGVYPTLGLWIPQGLTGSPTARQRR